MFFFQGKRGRPENKHALLLKRVKWRGLSCGMGILVNTKDAARELLW